MPDIKDPNESLRTERRVIERDIVFEGGCTTIGYATTIGYESIFRGSINLGRYCQTAPRVAMFSDDHMMERPSTHFGPNMLNWGTSIRSGAINIGNDVWIGYGVIVVGGVTVGNGACIGANTVVVRDVEPYTLVAGNPCRTIRKRFDDRIIEALQRLAWWDLNVEQLFELKDFFITDLTQDTEKSLALIEDCIKRKERIWTKKP